ncbi:hypothetical protein FQN60_012985 [Etheostoma spectabile]|uniref:Uncharacterized protein n=1 Tax=Etheostoma spectabile TaxID=54343 RepID=A0A5J5D9P8_9PERO|nr:hypothetical protein FQN60_012985 [Etheostoma spectabile]
MEGGIERREGRRRPGSSASRLSYGQWISWDNWLKVSLCLYCYSWLSGSVLCRVSRVICQVCNEERQWEKGREGGDNFGSRQAVVTSLLPAGCVNSTSDLHGNRAASTPPPLPLPSGRLWEQGGQIFILPLSLSASRQAAELWEAALDRAGTPQLLWKKASGAQVEGREETEDGEVQGGSVPASATAVVGRVPGTVI